VTRKVLASDGVPLVVAESGPPSGPVVVCVHGYPDNRTVWDGVLQQLAERYRVITYDVRGAGESGVPTSRHAYRLDQLAEDLVAVLDTVSPDRPVHLIAHDWGAIQTWHALTEGWLTGRVASYNSISGPSLDHAGAALRNRIRPRPRALREAVSQLLRSGYIGFFQLPLLPELAWRSGLLTPVMRRLDSTAEAPVYSDARHGLELYRENMLSRLSHPEPKRTDVPVQVLAPTGDPFVSTPLQTGIGEWVSDLRVRRLSGGHWVLRSRPEVVSRCATELIDHVEGAPESRVLAQARENARRRGRFANQLVVITGAGSGIGRATALAFAAEGADVAVTDIDESAVHHTAELAKQRGAETYAAVVDVSDGDAMADFAARLRAETGTPDIVVNNAGIGMAGPFTDTSVADWQHIIDVNLWGVIHGCRAFAPQLQERGEGGTIINVASAAAYLPTRMLPAYATTKSGVLTLSECLRAELADENIGVTAVCPGFVHTSITSATRFVGGDAAEQERKQRAATAAYRFRNYPPERVATRILRSVERDAALAPVTPEARGGLLFSRMTPGLLRAIARRDLTSP